MKRLLLLLGFISSVFMAGGQSMLFDKNYAEDTLKVMSLLVEGSKLKSSNIDQCIRNAEQGIQLSRRIKYVVGEVLCLNLEASALTISGNYPKALDKFLKALKISEKLKNPKYKGFILNNIGDLYAKQEDYRNALNYGFQAKAIAEQIHDEKNLTINLINIGSNYENLNTLDSALYYTNAGYELAFKTRNEEWLGIALNNLGNIYYKLHQHNLALEYYKMSIPYYTKIQDYEGLSDANLGIAKIFIDKGYGDSAKYYSGTSLYIAKKGGLTKYLLSVATFLADFYRKRNIDSAFAYQQLMIAAKDSLFSQEKVREVQNLSIGETLRQQEIADEKKKAEEDRRNNLQLIAIAAFIIIFTLFIILIGKRTTKSTTVNFMITVALLLMFEFISLLVHPYVAHWTHHTPVYMLLILVCVAAMLAPLHHRAELWIKETLAHKIIHPKTKKMRVRQNHE